ncbi:MAG: hypothetical protein ACOCX4_09295 [Planctomycetota bacterium]
MVTLPDGGGFGERVGRRAGRQDGRDHGLPLEDRMLPQLPDEEGADPFGHLVAEGIVGIAKAARVEERQHQDRAGGVRLVPRQSITERGISAAGRGQHDRRQQHGRQPKTGPHQTPPVLGRTPIAPAGIRCRIDVAVPCNMPGMVVAEPPGKCKPAPSLSRRSGPSCASAFAAGGIHLQRRSDGL